jgi:hypothetical protein
MRWLPVLLMITFAMPVLAGSIVVGFCDECGYKTDEFFEGGGMTPGYFAEIYRDPETGEFHLVSFNTVLVVADDIAVNINNSHHEIGELTVEEITFSIASVIRGIDLEFAEEIAVNITNNHREVGEVTAEEIAVNITNNHRGVELTMTWRAPEVLGELFLEDRLLVGVNVHADAAENPSNWELVNVDARNHCPACGGNTVKFERVGKWD